MRIEQYPLQPIGLRQVHRLVQQRLRLLAATIEREGTQAEHLDVRPPELELLRHLARAGQRLQRAAPVLRRNGRIGEGAGRA